MNQVLEILSWICLIAGPLFCVIGGIGLLRLPDFYTRTHGASITDTLGAGLVLVGLMLHPDLVGGTQVNLKLALILALLLVTSPTSGHALVKAAYARGVKADLDIEEGDDDSI